EADVVREGERPGGGGSAGRDSEIVDEGLGAVADGAEGDRAAVGRCGRCVDDEVVPGRVGYDRDAEEVDGPAVVVPALLGVDGDGRGGDDELVADRREGGQVAAVGVEEDVAHQVDRPAGTEPAGDHGQVVDEVPARVVERREGDGAARAARGGRAGV